MKNKNFIIAGIVTLIIIIVILLYLKFGINDFPKNPIERQRLAILYGSPEQKEQALTKFIDDVYSEKIDFDSAKILIPAIIEAILDDTPLPLKEDTGWGYVYHQAASTMAIFAYKIDGIDRKYDRRYSFFASVGVANESERKVVHDNWLQWWNENKNKI